MLLVALSEQIGEGKIANTVVILHQGQQLGRYRKTMLTQADAEVMRFCRDYELPAFQRRPACSANR